ncbi:MAG: TIGR00282 family metallophosphoesterase [Alphaproteobacteria bacterium]|nr:TIGR00282 family metallophosphoesterase [Alphaproteobacteria bacterium]
MRIIFLGDVIGRAGREGLARHLPELAAQFKPDAVIVNVENAAAGRGVTLKIAQEIMALGVDVMTTGNHVWDQKELMSSIALIPQLIRPINYPQAMPGQGFYRHTLKDGRRIMVVNVMGQLGMPMLLDDPFAAMDAFLARYPLKREADAVFVDFHAEASSEKVAMGHFLDGRVSAVIGTHTHIPTMDARLLSGGTATQTDTGMCGDYNSVIGFKKEQSLWRFTHKAQGERLVAAEGPATVCGAFIETDDATGLAKSITRIQTGAPLS